MLNVSDLSQQLLAQMKRTQHFGERERKGKTKSVEFKLVVHMMRNSCKSMSNFNPLQ